MTNHYLCCTCMEVFQITDLNTQRDRRIPASSYTCIRCQAVETLRQSIREAEISIRALRNTMPTLADWQTYPEWASNRNHILPADYFSEASELLIYRHGLAYALAVIAEINSIWHAAVVERVSDSKVLDVIYFDGVGVTSSISAAALAIFNLRHRGTSI